MVRFLLGAIHKRGRMGKPSGRVNSTAIGSLSRPPEKASAELLQRAQAALKFFLGKLQTPRGILLVAVALAQRLEQHHPLDLG
jgi:hypothetical protein